MNERPKWVMSYVDVFEFNVGWADDLLAEYADLLSLISQHSAQFEPNAIFQEGVPSNNELLSDIEGSDASIIDISLFSIDLVNTIITSLPDSRETASEVYVHASESIEWELSEAEFVSICLEKEEYGGELKHLLDITKEQFYFTERPEVGEVWRVTTRESGTPYIVEVVGFEERANTDEKWYQPDPYCLAKLVEIEGTKRTPAHPVLHLDAADFNSGEILESDSE